MIVLCRGTNESPSPFKQACEKQESDMLFTFDVTEAGDVIVDKWRGIEELQIQSRTSI